MGGLHLNYSVALVVPTIREQSIISFLDNWVSIWSCQSKYKIVLLIVEDNPYQSFQIPNYDIEIQHYCWKDIVADFGNNEWIISRRSDTVRNYGYYKAYRLNPDFVMTLDDDCLPYNNEDVVEQHITNFEVTCNEPAWSNTIINVKPRGFPYYATHRETSKRIVISHGLWDNVLDFDAPTQLTNPNQHYSIKDIANHMIIPKGYYFPMSGMNLAWRTEITPIMYFLLQGHMSKPNGKLKKLPYDRMGDIWCGIIAKRIADHLGVAIYSGSPYVLHNRASNVFSNLKKEAAGIELNEYFWKQVDKVELTATNYQDCFHELVTEISFPSGNYWKKLRKAMLIWISLFNN